jgi:hypothetical protein
MKVFIWIAGWGEGSGSETILGVIPWGSTISRYMSCSSAIEAFPLSYFVHDYWLSLSSEGDCSLCWVSRGLKSWVVLLWISEEIWSKKLSGLWWWSWELLIWSHSSGSECRGLVSYSSGFSNFFSDPIRFDQCFFPCFEYGRGIFS